jgi:hypothetical protein
MLMFGSGSTTVFFLKAAPWAIKVARSQAKSE